MPSEQDHLGLANHNQETIDYLCQGGDRFPDWVTTVAFYRAIHLIDAMFAHQDIHPPDHKTRGEYLKRDNRYKAVYSHYSALREASGIARYLREDAGGRSFKTFKDYATMERVKSHFLGHALRHLELSISNLGPAKKTS